MDYIILSGSSGRELGKQVIEYLNKGYKLAGEHQVTVIEYDYGDDSLGMCKRDLLDGLLHNLYIEKNK